VRTRLRIATGIAVVLLSVLGAVPLWRVADRLLPHAIVLWDSEQCAGSTVSDHAVFGMTGPLLRPGHGDIEIIDARPLGLSAHTGWRTWVVPVPPRALFTGALDTAEPPPGWPDRVEASDATVSSSHRAELDLEIWPTRPGGATSMRGFLVDYRTTLGIVRTVTTPTVVTTRPGGCG